MIIVALAILAISGTIHRRFTCQRSLTPKVKHWIAGVHGIQGGAFGFLAEYRGAPKTH